MIAGLRGFVAGLREEGIAASPAECIDALRAVRLAGVADRERFQTALRATLVKRSGQRAAFDRLFDIYFAAPARGRARGKRGGPGAGGPATGQRSRRAATGASARPRAAPPAPRIPDRRPPPAPARRGGGESDVARILAAVREGGPGRRGRLRRVLLEPGSPPGETGLLRGAAADPQHRDLRSVLGFDDERELAEAVPRLIERIRLRTGRRRRRAPSGTIYLRRLFRENLSHGGVPFVLPRRRLRPRRPKVELLVDVSWSCARAAALFLWMVGAFLRLGRETRVTLFVDRTVDATDAVSLWLSRSAPAGRRGARRGAPAPRRRLPGAAIAPGGRPFHGLLGSLPQLNPEAPSDYGRVFHRLLRSPARPRGRDTVLVILGDGRNNRLDPLDWAFGEVAGGCAATLWLVPEPLAQWGTGDSALADYLPHADLAVEARDLAGLGRGVAELLRRL